MAKTRRRKTRTHVPNFADPAKKGEPRSFVFWRGKHGLILKSLETDLRKVMQPNTATNLRESKRNQLKDFVNIAGPLGVTHFLILTATETAAYLRIAKTPRGPTLTMKIHEYALMRDVAAAQPRPRLPESLWASPPLVVLYNFGGQEELGLATVLFQNLFPPINVQTTRLSQCQRVVLLSYDKATRRISFRHYSISAQPSGVSKSVKALVGRRALPDMSAMQDVSEFLTRSGYGSESEGEEAAEQRVMLEEDLGRGNLAARQSRVRLQEIGPRMQLEVVKVEEGLCAGRVLFHSLIVRSAAETAAQQAEIEERQRLKAERRQQQAENVQRKAVGQKRKAVAGAEGDGAGAAKRQRQWWEEEQEHAHDDDDDVAYYREEVGEEPDDAYGMARHASSPEAAAAAVATAAGGAGAAFDFSFAIDNRTFSAKL
ncbi:hypothetical protein WJX81_008651 [Elliptochloris bilobata]|uniref:Brix domain-containing protein n=1 Tax=Elliptochloris bilobata TaxID=381761 RepID=A0AAW1S3C2_9CHLO